MTKPAFAGIVRGMEITDYMLWKALAIIVVAFLAGLFGFIGKQPTEGRRDKRPE